MTTSSIEYIGTLKTKCEHNQSQTIIHTAAPKDNMGDGSAFSPTDLTATSLGACMLSIMGIYCLQHNLAMEGSIADISKVMYSEPRRIGEIHVKITMQGEFTDLQKTSLQRVAHACPVAKSLHPDIIQDVTFYWNEK